MAKRIVVQRSLGACVIEDGRMVFYCTDSAGEHGVEIRVPLDAAMLECLEGAAAEGRAEMAERQDAGAEVGTQAA